MVDRQYAERIGHRAEEESAMDRNQLIVVGGGIGGSAAALRAAQHGLRFTWIRGDAATARASRARYVFNVDNMIGVSGAIVQRKVLALLSGPEHAAAREVIARTHFHIGIPEIIDDVTFRLRNDFANVSTVVDEKAVSARRDGDGFAVETDRGRTFRSDAIVLSTGVMDRQPSVKLTTKSGKVVDDIRWIYPWANAESLLYCILCEGHLVRGTRVAVFGASEAAAQVALLLHERYGVSVTLLGNGEALHAREETRRLLDAYGVAFQQARLVGIVDGEAGRKGESLRGFRLEDGSEVEARFGMLAMGLHPRLQRPRLPARSGARSGRWPGGGPPCARRRRDQRDERAGTVRGGRYEPSPRWNSVPQADLYGTGVRGARDPDRRSPRARSAAGPRARGTVISTDSSVACYPGSLAIGQLGLVVPHRAPGCGTVSGSRARP
jgi:thioredoxin reductase (NADPH)